MTMTMTMTMTMIITISTDMEKKWKILEEKIEKYFTNVFMNDRRGRDGAREGNGEGGRVRLRKGKTEEGYEGAENEGVRYMTLKKEGGYEKKIIG